MSGAAARVADAAGNWVDTRAPLWLRPYLRLARLDRPIGSWLLLMPCWWSAALAAALAGDLSALPLTIVVFFVGAFVMRGAGCTWNDITDRDLDAWWNEPGHGRSRRARSACRRPCCFSSFRR